MWRATSAAFLAPELNANIRAVPLDVERLWESAQISRKLHPEQTRALNDIIEHHNQRILEVIMAHDEAVEVDSHGTAGR